MLVKLTVNFLIVNSHIIYWLCNYFQTGYGHPTGRPVWSPVVVGPHRFFHAEWSRHEALKQFRRWS